MIFVPKQYYEHKTFPSYHQIDVDSQLERANIAVASITKQDDAFVCKECVKAGKITFECVACKQRKPTSKVKDDFGYPPEHLCIDCYETMPAKQWDELVEKLEEVHRYDYE